MRGLLTKLSDREEDVMSILWNTDRSLTATEIYHCNEDISKNTIQVVLRNLLKKEYIKVSDVVYCRRIRCRPATGLKEFNFFFFTCCIPGVYEKIW